MRVVRSLTVVILIVLSGVAFAGAQQPSSDAISNWAAPPTWTPDAHSVSGKGLLTVQTAYPALPFVAVTPCRVADTRGNGFTGAYGPPSIAANTTRSFTIVGSCGIPASAEAVSFNFAALDVSAAGDLRVYPAGGAAPLVSTLNYNASTPNIANAAIVPLGGGAITVQADAATINLIIDVNGYYGSLTSNAQNVFLGTGAGNFFVSGHHNVGIGFETLAILTSGAYNTGIGAQSLFSNQTGSGNTAVGYGALSSSVTGQNTAVGYQALASNASGLGNIAIGFNAAANLTSGSNNIHIGNLALTSENATIRIGTGGQHFKFFVAGVRGVTTGQADAVPVMIDGLAQLGTLNSSARVKRQIADVGDESSAILNLRPVSFFYRNDTIGIRQYGLIAEEVAEVMPDLVQFSAAGDPETVRYHFLPALLLNELQKQQGEIGRQQRTMEAQQRTIENQNAIIAGLEARLSRLESRFAD